MQTSICSFDGSVVMSFRQSSLLEHSTVAVSLTSDTLGRLQCATDDLKVFIAWLQEIQRDAERDVLIHSVARQLAKNQKDQQAFQQFLEGRRRALDREESGQEAPPTA